MPENATPHTTPSTTSTTSTPNIVTECDFQNDLCGWKHRDSTPFTFNRTTGQELTDANIEGPGVDHTHSKESKYL